MKLLRIVALTACTTTATLAWAGKPAESTPAAAAAIAESTNAVLQGDSRRAVRALAAVPKQDFQDKDAVYRACMLARHADVPVFATDAIADEFVRRILRDYQDYWWHAMKTPARRAEFEATLLARLRDHLGTDAEDVRDMDALEPILQGQLLARGYHAQPGRTLPLRELILWRRQETRPYTVELPEGPYTVRVELLDDFASRGWTAYGRCERGSAGGWATAEALYAVMPSYTEGLDSEAFRVVFLGHETQHFADQNAFPNLAAWELEYRAKLVELALAQEVSAKRLATMTTAQSDDIDSPHTYANKRVVADLTARLGVAPDQVSITRLQRAARDQLVEDTRRRNAAKAR
ncbi:hypothetical protein [Pseudoxanthomonas wuyuanensis]|uniref:Uncharacterized protein n=1 Tax=Pseudoxanthomonas wuyuanensis TaxID=1073196 RepID=A0A286D685_9GAMM|nr:hypothetical protein [Pseudoxanthomonas wuyuanensis]KAF1721555.1 hypothetical protein CSC75_07115 [Pseudoxanthomonas wuyuanensis]SOD54114.1 hypothetical protein SAMN06296416_10394 [Pseudoxanthomonas wuyuanensis]